MNQPVRVLIADDQRPIRLGLSALLSQYSQIEVVGEAADGQEAVQLAATSWPDVVLLDMQMPVMDGLQTAQQIKRDFPGIKVVGLTMYSKYKNEAYAAGVDAFLTKGCTVEALLGVILSPDQVSS